MGAYQTIKRMPLWRRILLILVLAAMATVAGVMLFAYLGGKRLGREIVRISRAGEPVKFSDLYQVTKTNTDKNDASVYYIEAAKRINPGDVANLVKMNVFYRINLNSLPANQFPGELRETVEKNLVKAESLFTNLDKGSGLPLSAFDIGISHGRQVGMSRLDSVQGGVFLLSMRTLDSIRKGDSERAASSIISQLKLIRVFDFTPTIFVQGRKMICIGLVCSDIQLLLNRCKPSEKSLETLQILLGEAFGKDALEKTLLAERVYQLEIARNLIPKKVASQYLTKDISDLPERIALPEFTWHRMRLYGNSLKYLEDMAICIKASQKPWPESLDTIINIAKSSSGKSSRFVPAVIPLVRLTAETLALTNCTISTLAIERYRIKEGRMADSLNALSPKYIKSIPLDPFTGKPLLYGRNDDSYTVYSTGINRADDKGAIIPEPNEKTILDTGIRIKRIAAK